MDGGQILTVIIACLGSTALFGFIQFLITRKDNKKDQLKTLGEKIDNLDTNLTGQIKDIGDASQARYASLHNELDTRFNEVNAKLSEIELGTCRAQLLALIDNHPLNAADIYKLAEYYFVTLHGDAFISAIFSSWVKARGERMPGWFLVLYPDASGGQDDEKH